MLKVDDLHYLNFGFAHYIGKRRLAWMRQESRHFVQKCNFPWHQIHKYLPCNKKNYMPTHSVWKSQKKSHSALRAKRATFTFWVAKSSLKMPKMVNFGDFLKTRSLRSNSVTRKVTFNGTKNVAFEKSPKSPKSAFLGLFNELLATQNVNVARYARNVEWDFFEIFKHCVFGTITCRALL